MGASCSTYCTCDSDSPTNKINMDSISSQSSLIYDPNSGKVSKKSKKHSKQEKSNKLAEIQSQKLLQKERELDRKKQRKQYKKDKRRNSLKQSSSNPPLYSNNNNNNNTHNTNNNDNQLINDDSITHNNNHNNHNYTENNNDAIYAGTRLNDNTSNISNYSNYSNYSNQSNPTMYANNGPVPGMPGMNGMGGMGGMGNMGPGGMGNGMGGPLPPPGVRATSPHMNDIYGNSVHSVNSVNSVASPHSATSANSANNIGHVMGRAGHRNSNVSPRSLSSSITTPSDGLGSGSMGVLSGIASIGMYHPQTVNNGSNDRVPMVSLNLRNQGSNGSHVSHPSQGSHGSRRDSRGSIMSDLSNHSDHSNPLSGTASVASNTTNNTVIYRGRSATAGANNPGNGPLAPQIIQSIGADSLGSVGSTFLPSFVESVEEENSNSKSMLDDINNNNNNDNNSNKNNKNNKNNLQISDNTSCVSEPQSKSKRSVRFSMSARASTSSLPGQTGPFFHIVTDELPEQTTEDTGAADGNNNNNTSNTGNTSHTREHRSNSTVSAGTLKRAVSDAGTDNTARSRLKYRSQTPSNRSSAHVIVSPPTAFFGTPEQGSTAVPPGPGLQGSQGAQSIPLGPLNIGPMQQWNVPLEPLRSPSPMRAIGMQSMPPRNRKTMSSVNLTNPGNVPPNQMMRGTMTRPSLRNLNAIGAHSLPPVRTKSATNLRAKSLNLDAERLFERPESGRAKVSPRPSLLTGKNSAEFEIADIKEIQQEMQAQLMILKTERELKDKVAKGSITNQEKEALDMIALKMSLDANSVH